MNYNGLSTYTVSNVQGSTVSNVQGSVSNVQGSVSNVHPYYSFLLLLRLGFFSRIHSRSGRTASDASRLGYRSIFDLESNASQSLGMRPRKASARFERHERQEQPKAIASPLRVSQLPNSQSHCRFAALHGNSQKQHLGHTHRDWFKPRYQRYLAHLAAARLGRH